MAEVTDVNVWNNGLTFFFHNGSSPSSEHFEIVIYLDKGGAGGKATLGYRDYDVDNQIHELLSVQVKPWDPDHEAERDSMIDEKPGLQDKVTSFIESAKRRARALGGNTGGEEQNPDAVDRKAIKRCLELMAILPVNELRMETVYSDDTGADDPFVNRGPNVFNSYV